MVTPKRENTTKKKTKTRTDYAIQRDKKADTNVSLCLVKSQKWLLALNSIVLCPFHLPEVSEWNIKLHLPVSYSFYFVNKILEHWF